MTRRWEVADAGALRRLLAQPPRVRGARPGDRPVPPIHFREVYYDTPDGDLRARGADARCRLRFAADGTSSLTVWLPGGARADARFTQRAVDAAAALASDTLPARRLRALCDPARLASWIERQVERTRLVYHLTFPPLPACVLEGDLVTVRGRERTAVLAELALRSRGWALGATRRVAAALEETAPLRRAGSDALPRALAALETSEGEALALELRGEREVALLAVEHGRIGLCVAGTELRLPTARGSGEAACRAVLRGLLGSGEGQLRLLGVVPPATGADRLPLEVWTARRMRRDTGNGGGLQWFAPAELIERVGSPVLRDARTIAALTVAARSPLVPEWSGAAFDPAPADDPAAAALARDSRVTLTDLRAAVLPREARDPARLLPEQFFDAALSWLEFNARVLALAEDRRAPAAARLRFLAIFATNLDQFVATQVAALKQLVAAERGAAAAQATLDALAIRLRPLLARQHAAFETLAAQTGLAVARWNELAPDARAAQRARFANEVLPFLHPKALTRAPGHPFPLVGDGRITLLIKLRDAEPGSSSSHYALVEIPDATPRFLPVHTPGPAFLPIEELARANLDLLYPGRVIVAAHAFRLTRSGDLQLDETSAANFLQAIEEELAQRPQQPVVRIEVEADAPAALQDLLQRELRFEESERESTLTPADVYSAPAPIDLGGLWAIARAAPPGLADYPPLEPRVPFAPDRPVLEQIDAGDLLVHHPFDSFTASVERFILEAAEDSDVQAIRLTLYRPGGPSGQGERIADALRRAAAAGKDVAVLVELKARFDEARNIAWARTLERQGIHVVTGLVSLKTHAKLALVVRRAAGGAGGARRYAHVGSGNLNAETAQVYTDVGLFTADPRVTGDVHTLFNELTGSTRAPRGRYEHLLVAPTNLLERLLALIEAETAAARAGWPARIRAKLNALADSTVIQALYRASQAGVNIDLVVRGICTLRPCVPGLSERIRVVSILGRFLEHARVYHFTNGGYFIGSADWRPRNLRRRVEVVTPVYDAAARAQLDALLTEELARDDAWVLLPDGTYERGGVAPPES